MSRIIVFIGLVLAVALVGALCLEYTVEFWAAFAGRATDIPVLHPITLIAALVLSEVAIPVAVVTWLLSFVVA